MTDEPAEPLLPPAPRLRPYGLSLALAGAVVAVAAMGADTRLPAGWLVGLVGTLVASLGLLHLSGAFDVGEDHAACAPRRAGIASLGAVLAAGAFFFTLRASVHATLPWQASAALVPATFLTLVAASYHAGEALGVLGPAPGEAPRPLLRRHGFWLVVMATLVSLPMLGLHSLTDPWETHYGEVAREMLSRDDWISTWWAQEGWFFSKPVLDFWLQALFMRATGVDFGPDGMLSGPALPRPEWAVRLPIFLFALLGSYVLYKGIARVFGRRAGLLGGLVLWTSPMWAMLSHQTMTDMPFVASMCGAMGAFLYGLATPEDELVLTRRVGRFRVSIAHVVLFVVTALVVAQALYLVSRNVGFMPSRFAFFVHRDAFWSGSAGNCGLPGNEPCAAQRPWSTFQPTLQAIVWLALLGVFLFLNRAERRKGRLAFVVAYLFCGLATLAKGPLGVLLPVACAGLYVLVSGRAKDLLRVELLSGLVVVATIALPWYVAMHLRHGPAFTDRLVFHDMWKRALSHVHDTNEGDDVSIRYYVWQLGYGLFPWTGLVPAALLAWTRQPDDADRGRGTAHIFLVLWFVLGFALFAAIETKFHHYIFPVVPAAAMLVGVLLDRMLVGLTVRDGLGVGALALGAVLATYGVFRFFPGHLDGFVQVLRASTSTEEALLELRAPSPRGAAAAVAAGVGIALWGAARTRLTGTASDARFLGLTSLASALTIALVGRDLGVRGPGENGADVRVMQLFTYNYKRQLPESLDFSSVFAAVTVVFVVLSFLAVMARLRARVTVMMLGVGLAHGAWLLSLYFVRTAPHWGQRETMAAYQLHRASPGEPLVAYQMNWKGENFYSGNRIPAFVMAGDAFKRWVAEQRALGVTTMFFTTEHGRVPALQADLGRPEDFQVLTTRAVNNKFVLVRARFSTRP